MKIKENLLFSLLIERQWFQHHKKGRMMVDGADNGDNSLVFFSFILVSPKLGIGSFEMLEQHLASYDGYCVADNR